MDKKTAARVWVELNCGKSPKECKDADLTTQDGRWAEMKRVALLASSAEVNRLWAEHNDLTEANVLGHFGHK